MKIILQSGDTFILRFDPGEELLSRLLAWCEAEKITAATLSVIGAAGETELRFYDVGTKQYVDQLFVEDLEITGLLGNVAVLDDKPVLHVHSTFGRRDMSALAGHVKRCVISVTAEVVLTRLVGTMRREPVPGTGLNLLA